MRDEYDIKNLNPRKNPYAKKLEQQVTMNMNTPTFEQYKNSLLKSPEFKEEYEKLEPEYQASRAIISARIEKGLTQKQLAELCGLKSN